MSEGELKKRLEKISFFLNADYRQAMDILDEAKKEFPEMSDNLSTADWAFLMYDWFTKWFGT